MKEKLKLFIENNYENIELLEEGRLFRTAKFLGDFAASDIDSYINDQKNDNKFQKLLFKYIDDRNLKDSDVYNKVNLDRRLFSKIRNDINYHPSKETIILLAISLELNEKELIDLLDSAAYSLPKNNYFDLIIRFCFIEGIYDVIKVNDLLNDYGCKLLN